MSRREVLVKFFKKFLAVASVLLFARVGAFALDVDDIGYEVFATMTAEDFDEYFKYAPAEEISEELFHGELALEKVLDGDENMGYIAEMLSVMAADISGADPDSVVAVFDRDGRFFAVAHLGSRVGYAYYIIEN